jgi:undecaprenyl-diphosphatase
VQSFSNEIIKIIAQDFIVIPVILATVVFFRQKTREQKVKYVAVVLIAAVLALIFAKIGGALINDPRPFVANNNLHPLIAHSRDNGFPSDHTLLSSLAGFVMLPFAPVLGMIGLVFALMIGVARIMANVHHPLDIIGSFAFTAAAVAVAYYSVKLYFSRKHPVAKVVAHSSSEDAKAHRENREKSAKSSVKQN